MVFCRAELVCCICWALLLVTEPKGEAKTAPSSLSFSTALKCYKDHHFFCLKKDPPTFPEAKKEDPLTPYTWLFGYQTGESVSREGWFSVVLVVWLQLNSEQLGCKIWRSFFPLCVIFFLYLIDPPLYFSFCFLYRNLSQPIKFCYAHNFYISNA